MLLRTRKAFRRTARSLIAFMASVWLLAAFAPCVMAAPMPMPAQTDGAPCHTDHTRQAGMPADCDALSILHCQQPQPTPPSVSVDIPAATPVLLYTLPLALDPPLPQSAPPYAYTVSAPPPLPLNRKQNRLLI